MGASVMGASFASALAGVMRCLAHLPQWALAVSEAFVALPSIVLCVVCCTGLEEGGRGRLLRASIPIAAALLVAEGLLCSAHNLPTWPLSMLDLLVFLPLYIRISGLTPARAAFVVMTNVFVAVDIVYYAAVVDALAVGDELSAVYLAWPGLVTQWLLWAVALPILWHAAKKVMPHSLTSPVVGERAWRTLWVMPTVLTLVVQVLRPGDVWIYGLDRVARDAIVFMSVVSALAVMTYLQLWRLMCLAERHIQTERELHRAELAREQVAHLDERIEASRRQRHDLRHHVHALQALLNQGDVAMARSYLTELDDDMRLEEAPIRYCDNPTVNTALVYYCDAARRAGAQVDVAARVPDEPAQRQSDVVSVLSNLLENAVNALCEQAAAGEGPLTLRVRIDEQPAGLYVTVDNTCLPERVHRVGGEFVSAKQGLHGLGLQSVREAARRTGGVTRFELDGSVFRASVLLGTEAGGAADAETAGETQADV